MYLIRYSEIGLKGERTRAMMEKLLLKNLLAALSSNDITGNSIRENGRLFIDCQRTAKAEKIISSVFGLRSTSWVESFEFTDLDDLTEKAFIFFQHSVAGKTFAIRARRQGAHEFRSLDLEIKLGDKLKPISNGVNLTAPESEVQIEIRGQKAYFFSDIIRGPGGLPLGSQGRMVSLLSGGMDSPLAAWYMMKRGVMVDFAFVSLADPYDTEITVDQFIRLVSTWGSGFNSRLYVIDGSPLLEMGKEGGLWKYPNVTFKKSLYLIAEKLSKKIGAIGIITGESLGQVSSQTSDNLFALSLSISYPVYRPLIGKDKEEIVEEGKAKDLLPNKNLGEFCSLFAANPITRISIDELSNESVPDETLEKMLSESIVFDRNSDMPVGQEMNALVKESENMEFANDAVVIDLRTKEKYDKWHYPGALNMDLNSLTAFVESRNRNETFILYCTKGLLSARGASLLNKRGFKASYTDTEHIKSIEKN